MTVLTTTTQEIGRDRFGRPMIIPPGGGKPTAYTRCTTYVDCIEDKFNLQQWQQRMVALGLASRPDLLLGVSAHRDDKKTLNKLCDDAREAAASSAAATTGTAIHALTELVDRGQELPPLPESAQRDLDAYKVATEPLKAVHIEQFVVLDTLKIGGTPDRIVEFEGERYIADTKTGSIDFGIVKIAAQLAVYSRASLYNIATGERTHHGASTNRGIIIHVPAGKGEASLHWVDLETGWEAVKVAQQVRAMRAHKFAGLTEPFGSPARPSLRLQRLEESKERVRGQVELDRLEQMVKSCPDADAVRALWAKNEAVWTAHLTDVAKKHIVHLSTVA